MTWLSKKNKPEAGHRFVNGGSPGVLVTCPLCDGDGTLHQPDEPPVSVAPSAEAPVSLDYWAWTLLANVSGGDWTRQTPEWQEAVARWREAFHASLDRT